MEQVATPLSHISLWLDGYPCANDGMWEVVDTFVDDSDPACSKYVDENWRIAYWHEPDGVAHTLEFRLDPSVECEVDNASGERLEATEIDDGNTVLIIGVEYNFEDYAHGHGNGKYEYDYTAYAGGYAATVELPTDAKAQWIVFGVCWLEGFDDENRYHPWIVGDPGGDRLRLPTGVYRKDGSGLKGGKTIEWFLPIDKPWERKRDVLALLDNCEVAEHTNADEGYENLGDVESVVEVAAIGLWLGFGDGYTLGYGGTQRHYDAYEGDYQLLKSDIRKLLADRTSPGACSRD